MARLFKGILYLILAIILLLIVAVAAVVIFVDPNHYRQAIATQVQRMTGRPFAIQGKLHWTVFPWLGISAENVQLGNPAGFVQMPSFLTIQDANLSVAMKPLLSGNIRFGKLILNGVQIHLIKNAQGVANWVFTPAEKSAQVSATNDAQQANVTYDDATSRFKMKFKLSAAAISALDINHAKLIFDDATTQQHASMNDFNLHATDLGFNKAFPLNMQMTFSNNAFPQPVAIKLDTHILLDPQSQIINLSDVVANVANVVLQGNIQARLKPQFSVKGNITIPDFNGQQLLRAMGKTTLPSTALQHVSATFDLSATPQQVQMTTLRAKVDDSSLNGNIRADFAPEKNLQFMLTADHFNVARYQTPAAQPSLSPVTKAVAAENSDILPLTLLREWNAKGQLQIGSLQLTKTTITNVVLPMALQQSVLDISPLRAQMYAGQLQGSIKINAQSNVPAWQIVTDWQNIDVNALLNSMKKLSDLQISGKGSINANLNMNGNDKQTLLSSLNGHVQFHVQNGILHGIDIVYYSELADALASKRQPTYPNTKQTPFQQLQGTLQLVNGVANNQDLSIVMPKIQATGKGSANLITEQLNYELLLQRLTSGSTVKSRGPAVPLRITGAFSQPQISLDWQSLLIDQAKQQLQEQVGKKIADVTGNSQLGQQVQQGLQSLLGG